MTVTVQVLFDQPQHEIASLLRDRLTRCAKASLAAGAATSRAFDALDSLLATGVAEQNQIRQHTGYRTALLVLAAGDQLTAADTLTTWSSRA
jgi:hypothetical protein